MSSLKLILLGFLRHTLTLFGAWLVAKGYLTVEARDAWVGKAVEEAFGGALLLVSYGWSAVDKQKVIEWIRRALHMSPPVRGALGSQEIPNEAAAARKISPLITSPGTIPLPILLVGVLMLPIAAPAFLLTSCASSQQQRTPLETAKLAYADASLAYEATMQSLVDLRGAHHVSDNQWKQIDYLQTQVQRAQPIVRAGINLWQSSGAEPDSLRSNMKQIADAVAFLQALLKEVQR